MSLKLLLLFFVAVQKSWVDAIDGLAVLEGKVESVNHKMKNNIKVNRDSSKNLVELDHARRYSRKNQDDPLQNTYVDTGHDTKEMMAAIEKSGWNGSLITEDEGNNITHSSHPASNVSRINDNQREETFTNNSLDDEVSNEFDLRSREDTYDITTPDKYPYSVLLIMMRNLQTRGTCTGSILSAEWILTASHCFEQATSAYVYAGGNSFKEFDEFRARVRPIPVTAQLVGSSKIIKHPKYVTGDSDVALVKLARKLNMTKYVNVVPLATNPWEDVYHTYTTCTLTGFGIVQLNQKRNDDNLRKTHKLEVKKPCLCFFRLQVTFGDKPPLRYICTRPKQDYGVCPGDSGGGLVCGGVVRGIAMQLIKLQEVEFCDISPLAPMQCGGENTLSVFQDICPFLPWINHHTKLLNSSEISKKCKDVIVSGSHHVRSSELLLILIIAINMCLQYAR